MAVQRHSKEKSVTAVTDPRTTTGGVTTSLLKVILSRRSRALVGFCRSARDRINCAWFLIAKDDFKSKNFTRTWICRL